LLTPVAKLYTAKQAIRCISETLECFGGAGYIEDTGLPRLLRDAQVLAIWEGTTNVLSLDALRAIDKESALPHFLADVRGRVATTIAPELAVSVARVSEACQRIEKHLASCRGASLQAAARSFAFALARVYSASLLLEQAQWDLTQTSVDGRGVAAARRWCAQELAPLLDATEEHRAGSRSLAL
jgi:putative acyl-CoA dehydrogenase